MALPVLRLFEPFYKKNKTVLLYIFFGGLTTVVSVGSFIVLCSVLALNEHVANIISWVLAVLFAYVTNRIWVFESRAEGKKLAGEMVSFFAGRGTTLAIEELIIWIFVTVMALNEIWVKITAQFVVLVSNYLLSKFIVFKK